MANVLEQVEFRDLQITLWQDRNGAYFITVDRWQDNDWLRVSEQINTWSGDGKPPTLANGLCRKLWDIYGKSETKETKA